MALTHEQLEILENIAHLMNRTEVYSLDIEQRLFIKRPSGDAIMLPLNLGQLIRIAGTAEAALTCEEITAKVNPEGNSGQETPDSQAMIERAAYDQLLYVAQKQAEVLANLTVLLTTSGETANVAETEVQRAADDRIDSDHGGAAAESPAAGQETDSEAERRVPRYEHVDSE